MLFVANGSCEIGRIYRSVRATEAAVRRHIRQLECEGIISQNDATGDKRKTFLTLTSAGFDLRHRYMQRLQKVSQLQRIPTLEEI